MKNDARRPLSGGRRLYTDGRAAEEIREKIRPFIVPIPNLFFNLAVYTHKCARARARARDIPLLKNPVGVMWRATILFGRNRFTGHRPINLDAPRTAFIYIYKLRIMYCAAYVFSFRFFVFLFSLFVVPVVG